MKNKSVVPTAVERVLREDDFIVSKTDPTGRITYGNRIFIEFSGYSEPELLGTQHNIIRHPDMPRSAFALMWDTIKQKREFHAYVKNMAKDGSFYWVFANITPDLDAEGEICGYFSVRRKPRREVLPTLEALYAAMLRAERAAGPRDAIAAGTKVLTDVLQQKGVGYDELVLSL